ncbi:MAG: divergent polysaccharide deacetylase family protein [Methylovirgula sp.]|uniref:divergent polysaccharide deacetylase family protein n=1 Tax=Methylovirgula sp. TaxID=1978224 RepID=UPI00307634E2
MPDDDLHKPLGLDKKPAPPRRRIVGVVVSGALGCAVVVAFVALRGPGAAPDAPQAMAAIVPQAPPPSTPPIVPTQTAYAAPLSNNTHSAAEIELDSGVKVVRANGGVAPDSTIIEIPQAHSLALTPAPDPRLVEMSRYGALPRIGADGSRPADVYARPVEMDITLKADAPRVVIVVGGLGLSRTITEQAIATLPAGVTFGFAPYGHDLKASVAEARANGHEIILQAPMEPMDYPQTNPGPHLLLTSAGLAANTDNLHWLMSRFPGYVGIGNFLGAKFTADLKSLSPVLQEIGERGLIYLDDGSSPQSLAMTVAAQDNVPAIKADIILDAAPDGIEAALVQLEAMARSKGLAIGVASALPESLEKIGRFARSTQADGLALVPLSAAVGKTTPSMVDRGQ